MATWLFCGNRPGRDDQAGSGENQIAGASHPRSGNEHGPLQGKAAIPADSTKQAMKPAMSRENSREACGARCRCHRCAAPATRRPAKMKNLFRAETVA